MAEEQPVTVRSFKHECRRYFSYLAELKRSPQDIHTSDRKKKDHTGIDFLRVPVMPEDSGSARLMLGFERLPGEDEYPGAAEEKVLNILNMLGKIRQPSYRGIIWMMYVQGMRTAEVADLYGMSKDYLSQLVSAEVRRLTAEMSEEE